MTGTSRGLERLVFFSEARGSVHLLPFLTTTVFLTIALVIAVTLPAIGLWSLLLLLASTPIEKLIYRRRKAKA